MAGQPLPPKPGVSLLPAFAQDRTISRDALWWLHEENRALRVGDWKIVASGKASPWELYDLSADRSESHNLAAAMPAKVQELAALWQKQTDACFALARRDGARPARASPSPASEPD